MLYCIRTQRFVCFSCCHGNMGWPFELVTNVNPKGMGSYKSTCSNSTPQETHFLWDGLFLCEMITILLLEGLTSICQWYCQDSNLRRSDWIGSQSASLATMSKSKASSAKSLTGDCTLSGKSFIYIKKSNGPKTVPWGTPEVTGHWLGPSCSKLG